MIMNTNLAKRCPEWPLGETRYLEAGISSKSISVISIVRLRKLPGLATNRPQTMPSTVHVGARHRIRISIRHAPTRARKNLRPSKNTKCNVCNDTKKRREHLKNEKREERKQNVCPEVKKEKTEVQTRVVPVKGSNACSEVKKERKEEHVTGSKSNTCCATKKKEHGEECAANHCFGNMADHWIERISMMKKDKEPKCSNNSSSSSSDSDSEDEAGGKNKKEKRRPTGAKNTSK